MSWSRLWPLFLLLGALACQSEFRGEFAWAASDDREIREPELSLLSTESYRLGRRRLYFFDYETIRWVYRLESGRLGPKENLVVALYEAKNTPTPVELDLREVAVEMQEGLPVIRQAFDPLPAGRYLVKIAHRAKVFDEVMFEVVPPDGPGAVEHQDDEEERPEEQADDILRYSSHRAGTAHPPGSYPRTTRTALPSVAGRSPS